MEKVLYKKSLEAKLTLNRGFQMEVYQTLMDSIKAHRGVTARLSFNFETVSYNKKPVCLIRAGRKNVIIYLALNQATLAKKFKTVDSYFKMYEDYKAKLVIETKKDLANALELLDRVFNKVKATELTPVELVDYKEVFFERSFGTLYELGLIKSYTKNVVDTPKKEKKEEVKAEAKEVVATVEEDDEDEAMSKVTFNVELRYEAIGAEELYLVTDYVNWDFKKAIRLHRLDSSKFTVTEFYPEGTKLEFKICASKSWADVEKGIWKEEISNHSYVLASGDLEVEDIIFNFNNK